MDKPDITVTVEAFQTRMLPPICVRTGEPAAAWIAVAAVWAPTWIRWWRWLPFLLAVSWLTRRRLWGWVPLSAHLAARVMRLRQLGLATLLIGVALMPISLAVGRPGLGWLGLSGQAAATMVGLLEPALSIEVRLDSRANTILLKRVHQNFRTAVAAPAARDAMRSRLEDSAGCA